MAVKHKDLNDVIRNYVSEVKEILGPDFLHACIYGSYARGEYGEELDIDIAIFTERTSEEFYQLIDKIAEITFEYDVKYDIILSPAFQNDKEYNRMVNVVPYFQSIKREGMAIG